MRIFGFIGFAVLLAFDVVVVKGECFWIYWVCGDFGFAEVLVLLFAVVSGLIVVGRC